MGKDEKPPELTPATKYPYVPRLRDYTTSRLQLSIRRAATVMTKNTRRTFRKRHAPRDCHWIVNGAFKEQDTEYVEPGLGNTTNINDTVKEQVREVLALQHEWNVNGAVDERDLEHVEPWLGKTTNIDESVNGQVSIMVQLVLQPKIPIIWTSNSLIVCRIALGVSAMKLTFQVDGQRLPLQTLNVSVDVQRPSLQHGWSVNVSVDEQRPSLQSGWSVNVSVDEQRPSLQHDWSVNVSVMNSARLCSTAGVSMFLSMNSARLCNTAGVSMFLSMNSAHLCNTAGVSMFLSKNSAHLCNTAGVSMFSCDEQRPSQQHGWNVNVSVMYSTRLCSTAGVSMFLSMNSARLCNTAGVSMFLSMNRIFRDHEILPLERD